MKSDEYEEITKALVKIRADLLDLSNLLEVTAGISRSNRARLNKIKVEKVLEETEEHIKGDGVVYLGEEGRLKP